MSTWDNTPHFPVSRVFSIQAFNDAVQNCRREVHSRLGPESLTNESEADTSNEDPLDVSDLTLSNLGVANEKIDRAIASIKSTDQWQSALRRDRTRPPTSLARAKIVRSLAEPHLQAVVGTALKDNVRYSGHLGHRGRKQHIRSGWERNYKHELQSRRVLVIDPDSQGTAPQGLPDSESSATDSTPVVLQICMLRGNHKRRLVRKFEILSTQTLADLVDSRDWFCGTDEHVLRNRPHIPETFFLIGDTFFFDDRVEDALRPGATTAATVARMLYRRNIGFAPPNNGGLAHTRQDGDTVHRLSLWERVSPLTQPDSNPQMRGLTNLSLPYRGMPIGDYYVRPMTGVRLASLNIQLGASYLYFHQGNCEHTFCFVDAFERPSLLANPLLYPRMVFRRKIQIRRCSVCSVEITCKGAPDGSLRDAAFVTFEDPLAGSNPCFFCPQCYWDLHYSADGRKLYDFKGHVYFYDS